MTQQDRLFVPLRTVFYRAFESGAKDIELRGVNDQFNPDTVYAGRDVEVRRGYSTDDSLWGTIADVWPISMLSEVVERLDHTRINPGTTRAEFLASAESLLGDYDRYIAFEVGGLDV